MILENVAITPSTSLGGKNPIYVDSDAILNTHGLSFSTDSIPQIYLNGGILDVDSSFAGSKGTTQPGLGMTIGTNATTEDWGQTQEATLQIKLDPQGPVDLMTIGGNANLAGTLELIPSSGTFNQGQRFTFLRAAGRVNGTFDTVTCTDQSLSFIVHYKPQSIVIEIL